MEVLLGKHVEMSTEIKTLDSDMQVALARGRLPSRASGIWDFIDFRAQGLDQGFGRACRASGQTCNALACREQRDSA